MSFNENSGTSKICSGQLQSSQSLVLPMTEGLRFHRRRRISVRGGGTLTQASGSGCAMLSWILARTRRPPNCNGSSAESSLSSLTWFLRTFLLRKPEVNGEQLLLLELSESDSWRSNSRDMSGWPPLPSGKIATTAMRKMLPATGTVHESPQRMGHCLTQYQFDNGWHVKF